jgi:nucleoside-diphosphate-sugar epimerase
MKKRVLVTGATGFVGQSIVRELLRRDYSVFALVRSSEKFMRVFTGEERRRIIKMAVSKAENKPVSFYKNILDKNSINAIIHAGAISGEWALSWANYYKTNVGWTKNLALALACARVKNKRFVFISTAGVYGTAPRYLPADESNPFFPDSKYAQSKVLAEKELVKIGKEHSLPLSVFRPTLMYGNCDSGFLYKIFRMVAKRRFVLFANPRICLLDVNTLSEACEKVLRNRISGAFNLAEAPVQFSLLLNNIAVSSKGGYFRLPGLFSQILCLLPSDYLRSRLILISQSLDYSNSRAKKQLNIQFKKTIANLNKYSAWYLA